MSTVPDNLSSARCVYLSYDDIGEACILRACEMGITPSGVVTFPWEKAAALSGATRLAEHQRRYQFELHETDNVNSYTSLQWLADHKPDIVVIAGWPRLVQQDFVDIPALGVFGMHPTLLPKHRGRAPIPWAIINGLTTTGVTLYEILDASADAGPIVGQHRIPIAARETATTLYQKVLHAHVQLIHDHLWALCEGSATRQPQDEMRASSWPRRRPADGIIDWDSTVDAVDTWIRALTRPYPGAFTWHGHQRITIWAAAPEPLAQPSTDARDPIAEHDTVSSGLIVAAADGGVAVVCGRGRLRLSAVQVDHLPSVTGSAVRRALPPGTRLG
jgi:methionyl-tRNA formyltransferase